MKNHQPRRQHLLEVASQLFSDHGYHNTGVDTITKHSGVSKTTLYKYFDTKEDLILETLEIQHHRIIKLFESYIEASQRKHPNYLPHQHIPSIFDATKDWRSEKDFTGCKFINASAEYSDPNDPIHQCAAKHELAQKEIIFDLLSELPKKQARSLSEQIAILIDGAIVVAQIRADKTTIDAARLTLETLLKQHFTVKTWTKWLAFLNRGFKYRACVKGNNKSKYISQPVL